MSKTGLIVLFCFLGTSLFCQKNKIDSLKNRLIPAINDTTQTLTLLNIGKELDRNIPEEALNYYQKALEMSNIINYKYGEMRALRGLGICYLFMGNYEESIDHTFKSIKVAEAINNYDGIVKGYGNIGAIYIYLEKLDDALTAFKRELSLLRKDDNDNYIIVYGNLGIIYKKQEKYDSSLIYYNNALQLAKKENDINSLSTIHHNIGDLNTYLGNYLNAKQSYEKSIELALQVENTTVISSGWINLGKVYMKLGDYVQAKKVIENGLEIAREKGLKKSIADGHKLMYTMYKDLKNTIKALDHYEQYVIMKDSILSKENSEHIAEMQTQYKTDQQQKENEILKKESDLKEARIKNQMILIFGIAICLIIAIFFARTYYRFDKTKLITNQKLKILNQEIQKQKEEITEQAFNLRKANNEILAINENLERIVAERTKEVKMKNEMLIQYSFINAHKLRAPVARILGLINIIKNPAKEEKIDEIIIKLEHETKDLDEVVSSINKTLEEEGFDAEKNV